MKKYIVELTETAEKDLANIILYIKNTLLEEDLISR